MDAISLLTQDHREVSKLFEAFEEEDADQAEIAAQVCRMLTVHAMVEEELFYPAAREALADDGDDLLDEAEVEHASAKNLIAQIEAEGPWAGAQDYSGRRSAPMETHCLRRLVIRDQIGWFTLLMDR
jgi:hemerythrin superfamily protein